MPSDVVLGAPASVRAHARTQHLARLCMIIFFYIDEDYAFEGKASRPTWHVLWNGQSSTLHLTFKLTPF